jgi:hypothetical protein
MGLTGQLMPDFKTVAFARTMCWPFVARAASSCCFAVSLTCSPRPCRGRWNQVQGGKQPGPELHHAKLQKRMEQIEAGITSDVSALDVR